MNKILILICLAGLTFNIYAQAIDSTHLEKPEKLPVWTIAVPGASYFYQKKYIEGSIFSTLEIGFTYLGYKYNSELKKGVALTENGKLKSPYYNYPKNIGIQMFYLEKVANMKNHLENVKYRNPDFRYHDISEKDLYLAPFKKENILTPITGIMVFLAGATLTANYFRGLKEDSPTISDIDKMSFADSYIPRDRALSYYIPVGLINGWGAGVIEEYQFRNWLMPLLDYKYGQKKGLIFSSLIFGVSHSTNFLFEDKINYGQMATQVIATSIGGMVYAWDVQKRNYNIGPAVAAHAWFDMILMVGSFLINPENNYLGVKFSLKL
jgi:membrane protease YdiL (CAAX protease family)